ncbi:hypothetical protein J2125_003796 [Erwinia toletana]|uniref:Uncharacterized protein n=1 Tax=Winslowiella toletana TaxID=92490 RepID=A0ABS4PD85_9GAMM|nr:hypothetical protein [Winslowiella toletana]MBP2170604.1 hypothetical protein [Winslowiella toletana]
MSTAIETVNNSKPQSSKMTGRDQVDIGASAKITERFCAHIAITNINVNAQKSTAARFASVRFIFFIYNSLA